MADITDVVKNDERINRPGFGRKLLFALISDFETIETPPAAGEGAELADEATIATDHVFKTGKGWKVLETTDEFNELTGEVVGDRDSRAESNSIEVRHPGLYAAALAAKKRLLGKNAVILINNLDGQYIQIGDDEDPMEFQASSGSGNKAGGYKGTTFSVSGYCPLAVYEGSIELESEIV